ncbi:hypothetical protein [Ethanoligenens sp.]|uniref:hypothetical protein n=1 Tax=Ethanoligenens sp. TaxID=2099655 RepID=UPI0039E999E4
MKKNTWQQLKSAFGVQKMDEMQMHINLQAIRWTYSFITVILFIWGTHDFILSPHKIPMAIILLILQNLVYYIVTAILKSRMGERAALRRLLIIIALSAAGAIFIGILLYFFH